ncbi:DUF4442 domain-containing protein [Flavobacterium sp. XGLA_31]|uniref:DUF4442 domain-containing protein n=1 Tax=Flavobacterium sp. XGLA_31 TaxID=3447666 RepID=UPI003F3D9DF0
MKFSPARIHAFLFFKLPSAFWCGVRVKLISEQQCVVTIKHKWFNQNPFHSIYFAVQTMAAELTTGALMMMQIRKSEKRISMLVTNNNGHYTKKATGRISFVCNDGDLVAEVIQKAIITGEGQTVWLKSVATDETGDLVSEFNFEWSIKVKL